MIPLCFKPGEDADSLGLTGHERYTIRLPSSVREIQPGQDVQVVTDSGKSFTCKLRIDTLVSYPVKAVELVILGKWHVGLTGMFLKRFNW